MKSYKSSSYISLLCRQIYTPFSQEKVKRRVSPPHRFQALYSRFDGLDASCLALLYTASELSIFQDPVELDTINTGYLSSILLLSLSNYGVEQSQNRPQIQSQLLIKMEINYTLNLTIKTTAITLNLFQFQLSSNRTVSNN